jgi:hypothetical protein
MGFEDTALTKKVSVLNLECVDRVVGRPVTSGYQQIYRKRNGAVRIGINLIVLWAVKFSIGWLCGDDF